MNDMDIRREKELQLLNSFYYLAPFWFLLETFFWPNFRAGAVIGGGELGTMGFYAVESALGVALWLKLPFASVATLLENLVYLVFIIKFIVLSPIDAAVAIASDNAVTEEFARNYVASLPGIILSLLQVVFRIKIQVRNMAAARAPGPR